MKKNVKYFDLVDVQFMCHLTNEIITKQEAFRLLQDNHISHYPAIDGHNHTVAVLKKDMPQVFCLCGYDLLNDEGTEITYTEAEKYLIQTLRPEACPSSFDLI